MWTVFRYALNRYRGQILGWGVGLAVLGGYLMGFYDTLAQQQEQLEQLLASYPPELMAVFGGMNDMFTPAGYLSVEFFSYMPLILGIFALLGGAGLLVGDEEKGVLDLVLAHPISRTTLFVGRLLALLAATLTILVLIWLGFVVGLSTSDMGLTVGELVRPFLSLMGELAFFGMLALLLSLVLPSRQIAAMTTGLVLVASFFVTVLARVDDRLEKWADLSPLTYYQGGEAILGLNGEWLAGLLVLALLFALLAWWRFERRDVRVAGEGGWRLPSLRLLARRR